MALKGRSYPTWLYSEKRNQGVLVNNAQEEDDLGVPVFDNPNLGKPRPDQGYMKNVPGPIAHGFVARRVKQGISPTGAERRKGGPDHRAKAGVSPTGKERRIFPKVA